MKNSKLLEWGLGISVLINFCFFTGIARITFPEAKGDQSLTSQPGDEPAGSGDLKWVSQPGARDREVISLVDPSADNPAVILRDALDELEHKLGREVLAITPVMYSKKDGHVVTDLIVRFRPIAKESAAADYSSGDKMD